MIEYDNHEKINSLLRDVRHMLEVEELKYREHADYMPYKEMIIKKPTMHGTEFNMAVGAVPTSDGCGSIACIGGSMYFLDQGVLGANIDIQLMKEAGAFVSGVPGDSRLHELFYPTIADDLLSDHAVANYMDAYESITPKEAIKAIDNYLNTEIPTEDIWSHVLDRLNEELEDRYEDE